MSKHVVSVSNRPRPPISEVFTRSLDERTLRDLETMPVRGGSFSVKQLLAARDAVLVEVLVDTEGNAVAIAEKTGKDGRIQQLIAMGAGMFDAAERVATLAVRP